MEYHEFVKRVQERAERDSPEQAVAAIDATLGTLGELLSKAERDHLAAQLHKPLKESLYRWIERPLASMRPPRFSLDEFYNRVGARSGTGHPAAIKDSLAVMSVLQEAVSPGQIGGILGELPDEYEELFTGRPRGPLSPTVTP